MDIKEIRKEYSRLRSIARKRLERMGRSEFAGTQTYRYFKDRIPTVEEISDYSKSKWMMKLRELQAFIASERSTITGMKKIRKESLQTLHENGYDFIDQSNWKTWIDFIDWWHDTHPKQPGSPTREEMRTYLDDVKRGMSVEEAKKKFLDYEDSKV